MQTRLIKELSIQSCSLVGLRANQYVMHTLNSRGIHITEVPPRLNRNLSFEVRWVWLSPGDIQDQEIRVRGVKQQQHHTQKEKVKLRE